MTDFDPAEFDDPPSVDPGQDYRLLLDAMRRAGADGVKAEMASVQNTIAALANASDLLHQRARAAYDQSVRLEEIGQRKLLMVWLAAASFVLVGSFGYWFAKSPKVERELYGCTAAWDQKTQTCKGEWVRLQAS